MAQAALIIGTGLSVMGSLRSGQQKQEAYEFEARAKQAQAAQVDISAQKDIEILDRRARQFRGAQLSAIGRSGVQVSGSPLLQLEETAANAYDEMQSIRRAAAYRKSTLLTESRFSSILGDQAREASYYDAAGGILSGIARNPYVYDKKVSNPYSYWDNSGGNSGPGIG